jgi:hypothetical protein
MMHPNPNRSIPTILIKKVSTKKTYQGFFTAIHLEH